MTLQHLQQQALELSASDRRQLINILIDSLESKANTQVQQRNLSRLRGIAKNLPASNEDITDEDYTSYLTKKYQ